MEIKIWNDAEARWGKKNPNNFIYFILWNAQEVYHFLDTSLNFRRDSKQAFNQEQTILQSFLSLLQLL